MADILPFPHKPEDRLRTALRRLDDALAEQKIAFAEFRTNLAALGGAVSGLESSVQEYQSALAATQQDVAHSHAAARRLEATAEIWLNQAR
jgi:septation ring formation regulator EzrA